MKRSAQAAAILAIIGSIYGGIEYFKPNPMLAWDQAGPNQAEVQSYLYEYILDNGAPVKLNEVNCEPNGALFLCKAPLNQIALKPGARHEIEITAEYTAGPDIGGTSGKSNKVSYGTIAVSK